MADKENATPQVERVKWERCLVQELGQVRDDWRPEALREEVPPRSPLTPSSSCAELERTEPSLLPDGSFRMLRERDLECRSPALRPLGGSPSILAPRGPLDAVAFSPEVPTPKPAWCLSQHLETAESPAVPRESVVLSEPEHEGSPGSPALSLESGSSSEDEIEALRALVGRTPAKGCSLLLAKLAAVQRENAALRSHLLRRQQQAPAVDARFADLEGWARRSQAQGVCGWLLELLDALEVDARVPGTVISRRPELEVLRRAVEAARTCERDRLDRMREVKQRMAEIAEAQVELEKEAAQARAPRKLAAVELGRMLRMVELVARDLAFFADDKPKGWSFPELARRHAETLQRGLPAWRQHIASL